MRAIVPVSGLSAIIDRFDGLIIDEGSIIGHDALYPGALDALQRLKSAEVRTVILAASSRNDQFHIDRLAALGVAPELYDRLLSTGQLMQQALVAQSLGVADASRRYFVVASPEETALFDQGRLPRVAGIAEADAVILLTLTGAEIENPESLHWLPEAAQRRLPLYAAKADVRALAPRGELPPGFATVLSLYRAQGGEVLLYGKPSGRLYARCLNILYPAETNRIGSIGDQFPADVFGARGMGIEPILVGSGAGGLAGHTAAEIDAWHAQMTGLCESYGIFELTLMPGFAWGPLH
ncbi:MAG: HAD-superfamily subfamily hydrolase like protein [Hyphomicrobiales bacterium]|nr:HAD-superfamily subfamily hydrolase like protein [Hyphomicrobiales bacterium]